MKQVKNVELAAQSVPQWFEWGFPANNVRIFVDGSVDVRVAPVDTDAVNNDTCLKLKAGEIHEFDFPVGLDRPTKISIISTGAASAVRVHAIRW
jgi:hypothetical protein